MGQLYETCVKFDKTWGLPNQKLGQQYESKTCNLLMASFMTYGCFLFTFTLALKIYDFTIFMTSDNAHVLQQNKQECAYTVYIY